MKRLTLEYSYGRLLNVAVLSWFHNQMVTAQVEEAMMKVYSAIDLHSNNSVLDVIDEVGQLRHEKRYPNELSIIVEALQPYREDLVGVVVESTYNWYWLVDGLMAAGFRVHLAHTAAVPQYAGLKHGNDYTDARHLANLLRLGILPEGHIYPLEQRGLRDLFRKRSTLVREQTRHGLSLHAPWPRPTRRQLSAPHLRPLTAGHPLHTFPAVPVPHPALWGQVTPRVSPTSPRPRPSHPWIGATRRPAVFSTSGSHVSEKIIRSPLPRRATRHRG